MAHLETLGDVHVEPVSVGIFLKRSRGFAELRPKVNWIELSFGLARTVDHPKITRIMRASDTRTYHCVRLREPSDVDADVRDWLTEAYLCGRIMTSVESLLQSYEVTRPAPHDRPWVLLNLVLSADGHASIDGRVAATHFAHRPTALSSPARRSAM